MEQLGTLLTRHAEDMWKVNREKSIVPHWREQATSYMLEGVKVLGKTLFELYVLTLIWLIRIVSSLLLSSSSIIF